MAERLNPYLGVGIYSVAESAMLTCVSSQRIRRWLRGYTFKYEGELRESQPVWRRQLPEIDGTLALGFLDLIEVRFVNAFRACGVSWKTIRCAAKYAQQRLGQDHPFCTRRFKTDGRTIFEDVISETGESWLIDVVKSQFAFKKILAPYLYEGLEFDDDSHVVRWWPMGKRHRVVIDPERCFGQPIVSKEGIPTSILACAFEAEGSVEAVANWYEVSPRSIQDAIEYHKKLRAA